MVSNIKATNNITTNFVDLYTCTDQQVIDKCNNTLETPKNFNRIFHDFWANAHKAVEVINQGFRTTVEAALEIGRQLDWAKIKLTQRGAYGEFRSHLELPPAIARQCLALYKVFGDFPPEKVITLASTTNIFTLTQKKYEEVVDQLRDTAIVTKELVQRLLKEFRDKVKIEKQKAKKAEHELNDSIIQQHFDADGNAYYTLRTEVNLSEKTGSVLAEKLNTQNLGQLLSKVIETPLVETQDVIDKAEHDQAIAKIRQDCQQELQEKINELRDPYNKMERLVIKQKARIAELEAQLVRAQTSSSPETETISEFEPEVETPFVSELETQVEIPFETTNFTEDVALLSAIAADQMLMCIQWDEVTEIFDDLASKTNTTKTKVFGAVLQYISAKDQENLAHLLANHKREYPRYHQAWNWLPKEAQHLKEKAFAIAQAKN